MVPLTGAGRLTRDGSDGGALPYSLKGVPAAPRPLSQRMPGLWRKRDRTRFRRRGSEDMLVEAVVLAYVVTERPEGVPIPALALHFNAEFDQGIGGSAIERAVRELVCAGRLRMKGAKVVPGRS